MRQSTTWKDMKSDEYKLDSRLKEEPLVKAAELLKSGESFVMVSVVKASGSTPRKEGARMIVLADGPSVGSVGGGALENYAIERSKAIIGSGKIERAEIDMNDIEGGETGAICGGKVELLFEPFGSELRLHLFGAGHVAQPTAKLAMEVGFKAFIYDSRMELATAERFPGAAIKMGEFEELAESLETTSEDFIAVMSYSHDVDYRILLKLLRKPFRYLGVIGSVRKAAEFRRWLKRDGFTEEEIARLTSPIGFEIGSHTPLEIAISVAAQLVKIKNEK